MDNNNSNPFNNNTAQPQPSQAQPQPPQPQPFSPPVQNQNTPLQGQGPSAPTGIFTEGIAPTQSAQISTPTSKNHSKKALTIVISMILIIALGVGGFFLYRSLTSPKKTIADFERAMSSLGYAKMDSAYASYSDSDGAYSTYTKANNNAITSVAMFYEMQSKDKLKELVVSSTSDEQMKQLLNDFDWSKERNEAGRCDQYSNYTCIKLVQVDNTLLAVMSATSTADETNSEIESVVSAMGY